MRRHTGFDCDWNSDVCSLCRSSIFFFFFQAEDGIRDLTVTGVQTCALPISSHGRPWGDAGHRPTVVREKPYRLRLERHVDPGLGRRLVLHVDESGPAAHRLEDQTAPEPESPVDLVGLTAEHRDPADAAVPHPPDRRLRLAHEQHRQVGVGAVLGDAHEVVVERLLGVRIDLHRRLLLVGQIADEVTQLLEALEGEPEAARREEAVAPAPRLRRLLQDEHARPRLARGEGGAHGGVAAPDHDDVVHGGHSRALPDDLADLDLRLDVRVIRDVAHDLLAVLAHPLLEVGDPVEVDVRDGDVGRRRAGRAARDALVRLGPHEAELAEALADQRQVLPDEVVVVELLALAGRVQDRDADHGNLLVWGFSLQGVAVYYGTAFTPAGAARSALKRPRSRTPSGVPASAAPAQSQPCRLVDAIPPKSAPMLQP